MVSGCRAASPKLGGLLHDWASPQYEEPCTRMPVWKLHGSGENSSRFTVGRDAARLAESIASFMPTMSGILGDKGREREARGDVFLASHRLAEPRALIGG